jgi:hypothetical protein
MTIRVRWWHGFAVSWTVICAAIAAAPMIPIIVVVWIVGMAAGLFVASCAAWFHGGRDTPALLAEFTLGQRDAPESGRVSNVERAP